MPLAVYISKSKIRWPWSGPALMLASML
jgi:hypothetical protein